MESLAEFQINSCNHHHLNHYEELGRDSSIESKDDELFPPQKQPRYQYGKLSPYRDSNIAKSKFNMYYSDAVERQKRSKLKDSVQELAEMRRSTEMPDYQTLIKHYQRNMLVKKAQIKDVYSFPTPP